MIVQTDLHFVQNWMLLEQIDLRLELTGLHFVLTQLLLVLTGLNFVQILLQMLLS